MIAFTHKYNSFFRTNMFAFSHKYDCSLAQICLLSRTNMIVFSHKYDCFLAQIWLLSRPNMIGFSPKYDGFLAQIVWFSSTNMMIFSHKYDGFLTQIWLPARLLIFDANSTQKLSVLKHRSHFPTTNTTRAVFLQFVTIRFEFPVKFPVKFSTRGRWCYSGTSH